MYGYNWPVLFSRTNMCSTLSATARISWSANGQAVNSEGVSGKAVFGKRADWIDYWGKIDDKTVGIAIFDHPTNPQHPTWWMARGYGYVAADPFGGHAIGGEPPGTGDPIATTQTDANGNYRFTGLNPGNYIVHIPAGEFGSGEDLNEFVSTTDQAGFDNPDNNRNEDQDENGIDDADYLTDGISSGTVTLSFGDEPDGNADGDDDANSNLSLDFGFVERVSLGNRVWYDTNGDGDWDAGEPGIANVVT